MKHFIAVKKNRLRTYLLILTLLAWSGLLMACGDTTSTAGSGALATATALPATTAPATTSVPTTQVATVTPVVTTAPPVRTTATAIVATNNPVIRFSANAVKVGEVMTISGSGYPANTKLNIALTKGNSQPFGFYGAPVTDAKGNFSISVKFAGYDDDKSLEPGVYRVLVKVANSNGEGAAASASLTLLASKDTASEDLAQARATLSSYLNALAEKRYSDAAKLFSGDVKAASAVFDPTIADAVKLFEKGCALGGGYQCLPVKSISQGKQIEPGRYEFMVELVGGDGKPVVVWPAGSPQEARSQFAYSVAKTPNGFGVVSPPVFFS